MPTNEPQQPKSPPGLTPEKSDPRAGSPKAGDPKFSAPRSAAGTLAENPAGTPVNPNSPPPAWVLALVVIALIALACAIAYWLRRSAIRAWEAFAKGIGGEFKARDRFAPAYISGKFGAYPFFMETASSHEDEAPYYHTRAAVPIKNPSGLILGLRHKSLLEEVQTRGENPPYSLGDAEFERRFFLVCNAPEGLSELLTPEIRRTLSRYHDIEIYIRFDTMEWRRAGEQNELETIQRLCTLLTTMADAVDKLPKRTLSLSQRLSDEALIQKGV